MTYLIITAWTIITLCIFLGFVTSSGSSDDFDLGEVAGWVLFWPILILVAAVRYVVKYILHLK